MATLSCYLGTVSFTHVEAARNKCLNLKIKITFLLKYPVCATNRATFFSFEWFEIRESYAKTRLLRLTQWLPKWGKLAAGVICEYAVFWSYRGTRMLFCIMSDHCERLRVIRNNRYLD